jgi:hypothetical protein
MEKKRAARALNLQPMKICFQADADLNEEIVSGGTSKKHVECGANVYTDE